MRHSLFIVLIALSGCATCQHHPVVCAAAVTVVGTSITLSTSHGVHHQEFVMHAPTAPHP